MWEVWWDRERNVWELSLDSNTRNGFHGRKISMVVGLLAVTSTNHFWTISRASRKGWIQVIADSWNHHQKHLQMCCRGCWAKGYTVNKLISKAWDASGNPSVGMVTNFRELNYPWQWSLIVPLFDEASFGCRDWGQHPPGWKWERLEVGTSPETESFSHWQTVVVNRRLSTLSVWHLVSSTTSGVVLKTFRKHKVYHQFAKLIRLQFRKHYKRPLPLSSSSL